MSKGIVAIDLDDTLAATTPAVIAYASELLGITMQHGDISSEAYWGQYGLDDKRAIKIVHGYNLAGFPNLQPLVGAREVLETIAKERKLYVLTSRDASAFGYTCQWVNTHFPHIFSEVLCVGNQYTSKTARTKADICREMGVEAIIDDNIKYLVDCLSLGVPKAFLFGDYAWNEGKETPVGIVRTKDWNSVRRFFDE